MYYTGFADEAAISLDGQIAATKKLGWHYIESRNINKINIHDLPEDQFEEVAGKLHDANISINCFGSTVANWACEPLKEEDFQKTVAALQRAIVRMKALNCDMIRGMSFRAQWDRPAFDPETEAEIFKKVRFLVKMCEDAGILYLHENCNNYGGMSYKHTLKLLEEISSPNLRLVFDTGNPVLNYDRSNGDKLEKIQDAFEFYRNVREFISYVHIKDAIYIGGGENGFAKAKFTFPGEGQGKVKQILTDLFEHNYDGGLSIEPHMKIVFHSDSPENDAERFDNYIQYGHKLMDMVDSIRK